MAKDLSPMLGAKLTKRFFMRLPQGVYLTSNCYESRDKPAFTSKVAPLSKRNEQWKEIIKVSADQRLCNIFNNKRDHEEWLTTIHHCRGD